MFDCAGNRVGGAFPVGEPGSGLLQQVKVALCAGGLDQVVEQPALYDAEKPRVAVLRGRDCNRRGQSAVAAANS